VQICTAACINKGRLGQAHKDQGEDHLRDKECKREFEFIEVEDSLVEQRNRNGDHPIPGSHHQSVEFMVCYSPAPGALPFVCHVVLPSKAVDFCSVLAWLSRDGEMSEMTPGVTRTGAPPTFDHGICKYLHGF
jgi:hypothetical protein